MNRLILAIILIGNCLWAGDLDELKSFIKNVAQGITIEHDHRLCGFIQMAEVKSRYHELDPATRLMADQLLSVQAIQVTLISPAGHFALHYDTSGFHAVDPEDVSGNGIPDYIDSAGVILDHVWEVEINQLGFRKPINSLGESTELYHVYFENISSYGFTFPVNSFVRPDGSIQRSSYIKLDNDFSSGYYTKGLDALRVTAAHEFNHACQFSYHARFPDSYIDVFLMEMAATWMEDFVYDDVNDYYQYLEDSGGIFDGFYNFSFNSRYGTDPYANCLFLHMTEVDFGSQFNVDLWEHITPWVPAFSALDSALTYYDVSFAEMQNQYAAWLYFTGSRFVPGAYFPEAANYPEIEIQDKPLQFEFDINATGMRVFKLPITQAGIYQAYSLSSDTLGMFNHISGNQLAGGAANFNNKQLIFKEGNNDLLVVLSNPLQKNLSNISYKIDAVQILQYPNPVTAHQQGTEIVFKYVPSGGVIRVFDVLGRLVKTLNVQDNGLEFRWNVRNEAGGSLASAMYFYHVLAPGVNTSGKIVIIR